MMLEDRMVLFLRQIPYPSSIPLLFPIWFFFNLNAHLNFKDVCISINKLKEQNLHVKSDLFLPLTYAKV